MMISPALSLLALFALGNTEGSRPQETPPQQQEEEAPGVISAKPPSAADALELILKSIDGLTAESVETRLLRITCNSQLKQIDGLDRVHVRFDLHVIEPDSVRATEAFAAYSTKLLEEPWCAGLEYKKSTPWEGGILFKGVEVVITSTPTTDPLAEPIPQFNVELLLRSLARKEAHPLGDIAVSRMTRAHGSHMTDAIYRIDPSDRKATFSLLVARQYLTQLEEASKLPRVSQVDLKYDREAMGWSFTAQVTLRSGS